MSPLSQQAAEASEMAEGIQSGKCAGLLSKSNHCSDGYIPNDIHMASRLYMKMAVRPQTNNDMFYGHKLKKIGTG